MGEWELGCGWGSGSKDVSGRVGVRSKWESGRNDATYREKRMWVYCTVKQV